MSAPTASEPVVAHSTASGAVAFNFEVTLNGAFGQPHVEDPIDFDAALASYPSGAALIDEPDWSVGGTPVGIQTTPGVPVYREPPEERLNQGDIFAEIPFVIPQGDERHTQVMPGLVVSHDCECDKFFEQRATAHDPDRWCVAVVPLYPLSDLKGGQDGDARKGRIRRWFYVPEEGGRDEMVADFWLEQPIPIVQLLDRERLATLSEEYVKRLHIQIWELRTRIPAATAFGGGGKHAT